MSQLLAEHDLVLEAEQEEDMMLAWTPSSKTVLSSQSWAWWEEQKLGQLKTTHARVKCRAVQEGCA